jgi:hypothetical protein
MLENVKVFVEKVDADAALRRRLDEAEALYPGSLEIREALVSAVVLPVAEELGLPFTVDELRDYEEERWEYSHSDACAECEDAEGRYWLMGRGWGGDEGRFCGDKK